MDQAFPLWINDTEPGPPITPELLEEVRRERPELFSPPEEFEAMLNEPVDLPEPANEAHRALLQRMASM